MRVISQPAIGGIVQFCVLVLVGLMMTSIASAQQVAPALLRPALLVVNPEKAYLLGIAKAGERLVAVGERGIIVLSDDNGISWRQVPVPVSVTLNVVRFADARNGFVAGHGGSVLTSRDGGDSWTLSLDGRRAAEITLAAARSRGDERAVRDAERLIADGPDKPLLDVLVRDASTAFVVGAYGLSLVTRDGGQSWQSWLANSDNPGGLHLNAIRGNGNRILIVGEQGLVLLSDDGGGTFRTLETPYGGSYFTAELPSGDTLVVAGLRGNTLRSTDDGKSWAVLSSPVEATITASALQPDGELVFVNQAGMLLHERAGRLQSISQRPLPPLNNLLPTRQAEVFVLSEQGVIALNVGDRQ